MQARESSLCSMVGGVDSRYEAREAGVAATAVQGSLLEGLATIARQSYESDQASSIEDSAQQMRMNTVEHLLEVARPAKTTLCCMIEGSNCRKAAFSKSVSC